MLNGLTLKIWRNKMYMRHQWEAIDNTLIAMSVDRCILFCVVCDKWYLLVWITWRCNGIDTLKWDKDTRQRNAIRTLSKWLATLPVKEWETWRSKFRSLWITTMMILCYEHMLNPKTRLSCPTQLSPLTFTSQNPILEYHKNRNYFSWWML